MYILNYESHFDAAHRLLNYEGKCRNLHGHRWQVKLYLKSGELNEQGMVMDFSDIKKILEKILPDHQYLNEIYSFNPTCENICHHLFYQIKKEIPILHGLELFESPNASVYYYEG